MGKARKLINKIRDINGTFDEKTGKVKDLTYVTAFKELSWF